MAVIVILVLPFAIGQYVAYEMSLYFLYAAAAIGLGLCWGGAGFLPLGQAMFFGIAAYLAGFALIGGQNHPWLTALLPLAAIASGLIAFAIGILVFRTTGQSGPYFSMITLALSLLTFEIARENPIVGGFNGLHGIPSLPGLSTVLANYYVAVAGMLVVLGLGAWLFASPLGLLWRALAQNERRVALFGFDTNRLKAIAFGVSGLFAGIGGMLYAPQQGLVTPEATGFNLSADLLIWTAVGGRGWLFGPVLGTLLVGMLTSQLRDTVRVWEVLMAVLFIAVVLAVPQGLVGFIIPIASKLNGAAKQRPAIRAPKRLRAAGNASVAVENVSVRVGDVSILDNLALSFDEALIFCVIGPNGAGKTSTFNVLTGELRAGGGRVLLDGADITGLPAHRITSLGVGRKLQVPSIFPELSIADNLCVGIWSGRASGLMLLDPRLRRWTTPVLETLKVRYPFLAVADRKAGALSHGERQLLELAMALVSEPRILLLDEPCAGLSPEETAAVIDVIRWARDEFDGAIVVIEHDMALVQELAQVVYVLHGGTVLARGSVSEIRANADVQAVYVGSSK